VPGLVGLTEREVRLADGSTRDVDAIVAATGYRPALGGLIGHLDVLDERGWPRWAPSVSHEENPGLFTVGFRRSESGQPSGLAAGRAARHRASRPTTGAVRLSG
jgi:putative flavoprotein involved in K+ transport